MQKSQVSDKPGETKALHFYSLGRRKAPESNQINIGSTNESADKFGSASLVLVDMPGYGFAYMNDDDKQESEQLIMKYLRERGSSLKRVLLLLDGRYWVVLKLRLIMHAWTNM